MNPPEGAALGLVACGVGLAIFYSAFPRLKLWRKVADTPTSKARSAAMGFVELSGLALADGAPDPGPLSGLDCAWWRFTVEEERTRRDSEGKLETYWAGIADESSPRIFLLQDKTGQLRVNPLGADIKSPARLKKTCGGFFGSPLPVGPAAGRFSIVGGRRLRFTEWRIEPLRPLFALGSLQPEPEGATVEKGADQPFILATMSEAELSRQMRWGVAGFLIFGALFFVGGLYLIAAYVAAGPQ